MSAMTQVEVEINGTKERKCCWVPSETNPTTGGSIKGGHKITRTFTTLPEHALPKRHWTEADMMKPGTIDAPIKHPTLANMEDMNIVVHRGHIEITNLDTGELLYENHNVIVNGTHPFFARILQNFSGMNSSVWGLALGAGGGWSANSQPDPTVTQTAMVSEIKRKPFNSASFLDSNGNPTSAITNLVKFTTIFNATTDQINLPIREMGLIGGGISAAVSGGPTDMLTAPYWDPAVADPNTVSLLTYKTLPPFSLPDSVSIGISWTLIC